MKNYDVIDPLILALTIVKFLKEILECLEEESARILDFLDTNGLVANPGKTVLMVMNIKNRLNKTGLQPVSRTCETTPFGF